MSVWKPIGGAGGSKPHVSTLPSDTGRYLLWLEEPLVQGEPHWVHFSWKRSAFRLRDFVLGVERRQGEDYLAADVWRLAKAKIPCSSESPHGDLFRPVTDVEFWTDFLQNLAPPDGEANGTPTTKTSTSQDDTFAAQRLAKLTPTNKELLETAKRFPPPPEWFTDDAERPF